MRGPCHPSEWEREWGACVGYRSPLQLPGSGWHLSTLTLPNLPRLPAYGGPALDWGVAEVEAPRSGPAAVGPATRSPERHAAESRVQRWDLEHAVGGASDGSQGDAGMRAASLDWDEAGAAAGRGSKGWQGNREGAVGAGAGVPPPLDWGVALGGDPDTPGGVGASPERDGEEGSGHAGVHSSVTLPTPSCCNIAHATLSCSSAVARAKSDGRQNSASTTEPVSHAAPRGVPPRRSGLGREPRGQRDVAPAMPPPQQGQGLPATLDWGVATESSRAPKARGRGSARREGAGGAGNLSMGGMGSFPSGMGSLPTGMGPFNGMGSMGNGPSSLPVMAGPMPGHPASVLLPPPALSPPRRRVPGTDRLRSARHAAPGGTNAEGASYLPKSVLGQAMAEGVGEGGARGGVAGPLPPVGAGPQVADRGRPSRDGRIQVGRIDMLVGDGKGRRGGGGGRSARGRGAAVERAEEVGPPPGASRSPRRGRLPPLGPERDADRTPARGVGGGARMVQSDSKVEVRGGKARRLAPLPGAAGGRGGGRKESARRAREAGAADAQAAEWAAAQQALALQQQLAAQQQQMAVLGDLRAQQAHVVAALGFPVKVRRRRGAESPGAECLAAAKTAAPVRPQQPRATRVPSARRGSWTTEGGGGGTRGDFAGLNMQASQVGQFLAAMAQTPGFQQMVAQLAAQVRGGMGHAMCPTCPCAERARVL